MPDQPKDPVKVKVNPLKRPTIKRIKDPIPKSTHKLQRVPNPKKK